MNIDNILKQIYKLPQKEDGAIYISALKPLVSKYKNEHELAIALWDTKDTCARELAVRIADPKLADETLLEEWLKDLGGWGITDAFTGHLVRHTRLAIPKAYEWANRGPEFEKRAGFATMAQLAWSKNTVKNSVFIDFLPVIERESMDGRFYVKKAVNWALRDIAKRNSNLRKHAQNISLKLQNSDDKTAQWVGRHRAKEIFS